MICVHRQSYVIWYFYDMVLNNDIYIYKTCWVPYKIDKNASPIHQSTASSNNKQKLHDICMSKIFDHWKQINIFLESSIKFIYFVCLYSSVGRCLQGVRPTKEPI